MTHAADAIFYLTIDDRLYSNGDSPPFSITHIPGEEGYGDDFHKGEKEPFDITHLGGKIVTPKPLPDVGMSFKSFVKLVAKPKTISPPSPYLPPE